MNIPEDLPLKINIITILLEIHITELNSINFINSKIVTLITMVLIAVHQPKHIPKIGTFYKELLIISHNKWTQELLEQ